MTRNREREKHMRNLPLHEMVRIARVQTGDENAYRICSYIVGMFGVSSFGLMQDIREELGHTRIPTTEDILRDGYEPTNVTPVEPIKLPRRVRRKRIILDSQRPYFERRA